MLAAKFDPGSNVALRCIDGSVFLDRDPIPFRHVLNYLRNGCQVVSDIPDELLKDLWSEADYFGLLGLKGACVTLIGKRLPCEKKSKTSEETMEYQVLFSSPKDSMRDLASKMNDGWRVDEQATALGGRGCDPNFPQYMLYRPKTKEATNLK
jgi:hypothetical protein